jgi:hypothetical protein
MTSTSLEMRRINQIRYVLDAMIGGAMWSADA